MTRDIAKFEAYVDAVMETYHAPGMVISVVDKNGAVLYESCRGYRDLENGLPVTPDTIFGMASLTKSVTAVCIMQLVEEGKIDLDKPVSFYFPELEDKEILVWHLLSHCAGFYPLPRLTIPDVAEQMGIFEGGKAELAFSEALAIEGRRQVIERFNRTVQRLPGPGEVMSYCNDAYGLLSELIRVCGDEPSYAEYVRRHILEQLGMNRSGCEFVKPFSDSDCTTLYYPQGGERKHCRDFYDKAFVLHGGGALRATLRDMRKYLNALMNDGGILISADSMKQMKTPKMEYCCGVRYASGLTVVDLGDDRLIMHNGGLTGISNNMAWLEERGIGVLVFCNMTSVPAEAVSRAALAVFAGVDLWPETQYTKPAAVVPFREDILGKYRSDEAAHSVDAAVELYQKGDGSIGMREAGAEKECFMLTEDVIIVCRPLRYSDLMVVRKDGEIVGLRYNGRIIPKIS